MGLAVQVFLQRLALLCGIILTHLGLSKSYNDLRARDLAERKAGQLMWVGFHDLKQLQTIKASGVVFFGWNMKSAQELQSAVRGIREVERNHFLPRILTAIDHEGGKVIRLKQGLTHVPDAAALGATQDTSLVTKVSFLMARELKNIGVDINFAPVMDRGDARSFLENRIWGNDVQQVTQMTAAFLEGHVQGGTFPFPKHFPGHGPKAFQDAHFLRLVNKLSKQQLIDEELPPFLQAMRDPRFPAVMTAHVELSSFDREPASLSKKVLSDFLRNELGYSGFVLSDDLEMGAVSQSVDLGETAVKSLKSGVDAVLVVWDKNKQLAVRNRIADAILSGELSAKEVDEKIARIEKLRNRVSSIRQESKKNPSLAYEEKLEVIEQAWANSQTWLLGTESHTRELFKSSESWTVLLPKGNYARVWKSFRPTDKLTTLDTQRGDYHEHLATISSAMQASKPLVVVTPPLHKDGGEWVKSLTRAFNSNFKNYENRSGPVLWVHLGMKPVNTARIEKPLKPLALVYLNSSTTQGLRHFLRMLGSRPNSWNSVSQRYSSF